MTKVYKAIIVDDEPTARDILMTHMVRIPIISVEGYFKNAIDALSYLKLNPIDVVFLDINMPEVSGLSFGKLIKNDVKLIFTTAHREYAVEGFDLQAVDYLLKPISFDRLLQAIHKFAGETEIEQKIISPSIQVESSNFVFVRADRKMVKIDFDRILYVESVSDYIKIITIDGQIVTRETISNFEAKLPQASFMRTHRSYIASIPQITSFTNEYVEVPNKAIPISRSYKDDVLGRLQV